MGDEISANLEFGPEKMVRSVVYERPLDGL
jgi:hypothetical protein